MNKESIVKSSLAAMNANEFLARARGFLASEPVYALHDAGMAVALYAQNHGLHNFLFTSHQNDTFFNDLRKSSPANVHHPSHNVQHGAPQIPIHQKIDFSKTIF